MKLFLVGPKTSLADLYSRITECQSPGPDGIDPAVKALVTAWEVRVSETIQELERLLGSDETFDSKTTQYRLLIAEEEAQTIRVICTSNPHSIFKNLNEAEVNLRLLLNRLQAKITEEKTP